MKNFNHNHLFPAGELPALLRKARPYQERITADKRLTPFAQIAFGNFFYPQNVIRIPPAKNRRIKQ